MTPDIKPRITTAAGPVPSELLEVVEVTDNSVRIRYLGPSPIVPTRIECPEGGEVPPIPGVQIAPGADIGLPRRVIGAYAGKVKGTGDVIRNGQVVRDPPQP